MDISLIGRLLIRLTSIDCLKTFYTLYLSNVNHVTSHGLNSSLKRKKNQILLWECLPSKQVVYFRWKLCRSWTSKMRIKCRVNMNETIWMENNLF